jgi:hypothetical protein
MTQDTNDQFDHLLKAMASGEPPKRKTATLREEQQEQSCEREKGSSSPPSQ